MANIYIYIYVKTLYTANLLSLNLHVDHVPNPDQNLFPLILVQGRKILYQGMIFLPLLMLLPSYKLDSNFLMTGGWPSTIEDCVKLEH